MAVRRKFTRYTQGRNQEVIVPKPIAIAASGTYATLAAFVANAPAGAMGVFNEDTGAVLQGAAISGTTKFTVALKMSNGSIRKTVPIAWNKVASVTKKLYQAPTKAQGFLGWNGSGYALNLAAAVAVGNFYEIALQNTTEGNQPYDVWNFEYQAKANDVEADVVQGLVKLINDTTNLQYKQNNRMISAKARSNGTFSNFTLGGTTPTATFTNGSAVVTLGGTTPAFSGAVGDFLSIDPSNTPDATNGDVYKIIATNAGVSFTLNRPFQGANVTLTQAQAQGTRLKKVVPGATANGIEFNSLENQTTFIITARQGLKYADINNMSSFVYGNGLPEQIYELELEGNTYAGNTAGNTVFGNEAYGNPDKFGYANGDTETYDLFTIEAELTNTLTAMPGNPTAKKHTIIAAPKSAGGITADLATLFGV